MKGLKGKAKSLLRHALSIAVSAALLAFVFAGADFEQLAHTLRAVRPGWLLLAGALLIALSGPLISLFNVSAQAAADARSLVAVSALTMLLSQFASLLVVGVLRAGGDVKYSLVLDVGTVWAIGVPLVALSGLVLGWPIHMVYLMSRLESVVKVLFGFWRLRSGKWIHNLVR